MAKINDIINFIDVNDGRVEITQNKDYWTVEVELENDANYAMAGDKTLKGALKKAYNILMTEAAVETKEVQTNDGESYDTISVAILGAMIDGLKYGNWPDINVKEVVDGA
jgi:hypothetical protein